MRVLEEIITVAPPDESARARAARIEKDLNRYAAVAFKIDRAAGRRPAGLRGAFFDLLKSRGRGAMTAETIRRWVKRSG